MALLDDAHVLLHVDNCPPGLIQIVEILNEDQQLFIEAKAAEYESVTGIRRDWWIGLTDEGYENR